LRFFTPGPPEPIIEDTSPCQEADSTNQGADDDNGFGFPSWPPLQHSDEHYQAHAEGGADDLGNDSFDNC
jgi:hypothetical protein